MTDSSDGKVSISISDVECRIVRIDKLMVEGGFASSLSEAMRLVKQNAVTIKDGDLGWEGREVWGIGRPNEAIVPFGRPFQMRVGRRHKEVTIAV